MRYLFVVFFITGCGLQQQIDGLKKDNESQNQQIAQLQQQVAILTATINSNIVALTNLGEQADQLGSQFAILNTQYQAGDATLQAEVDDLNNQIEGLTISEASLQLTVTTQTSTLAQLQLNQTISEFVDPCGPSGGYDEVLMRTSTGTLIAYFEDGGGNRHLSILTPGTYQTTDAQRCVFSVNGSGQVCDAGGCH